jgi:hypothetical protein
LSALSVGDSSITSPISNVNDTRAGLFRGNSRFGNLVFGLVCLSYPREKGKEMQVSTKAKCVECERVFDLMDEEQAGEFYYGHDCESEGQ